LNSARTRESIVSVVRMRHSMGASMVAKHHNINASPS
jgi:hypothetical protein